MLIPVSRRDAIRRRLLAWYDAGHRALPWRFPQDAADPYRVWLAEVMLQQTRVAAVVPYYRRFSERWPTLEALAQAKDEDVFAAWSGLGYYARCRNLLAAAREALRRHGALPASVEALRALPGFGRYTAGAVASIAFGIPAPAVDGNAARVLARLFLVEGDPAAGRVRERLWALAPELVPPSRPGDFNQSLMELGATHCRKPEPICRSCPLAALCRARRAGRQALVPPARRRPLRRRLRVACAVAEREGKVLLARREGRGLFEGLWELPSVEVREGVAPPEALARAMAERFAVGVSVGSRIASVKRMLTHRELQLEAYACRLDAEPRLREDRLRWTDSGRAADAGMATAMQRLLDAATGPGARRRESPATRGSVGSPRKRAQGTRERLTSRDPAV